MLSLQSSTVRDPESEHHDGLLALARELLQRIAASDAPTLALSTSAGNLLQRLTAPGHGAGADICFVSGWLRWYRYLALPAGENEVEFEAAVAALEPCFLAGLEPLPDPLLSRLARAAVTHAFEQSRQAREIPTREPLTATADLWNRMASATEDGFERSAYWGLFAVTLYERFAAMHDPLDLDWSVEYFQKAWNAEPAGDPRRLTEGCGLAFMVALNLRFATRATVADLDRSIAVGEDLLTVATGESLGPPELLATLSMVLQMRFDLHGIQDDLNRSIALSEQAVLTPADDPIMRAAGLLALAEALQTRFGHLRDPADLDRAIQVAEDAIASAPADHLQHGLCTAGLGVARLLEFEYRGLPNALDQSIVLLQEALRSTPSAHSSRSVLQANLALALLTRFEAIGAATDLDGSIRMLDEVAMATETPAHTDRAKALTNLCLALQLRFERTRDPVDLDRAIDAGVNALDTMPVGQPDRPRSLATVASAFDARYVYAKTSADLDQCIARSEEAVEALPADAAERPRFMDNLAVALCRRFRRDGTETDLDRAIDLGQQALSAAHRADPARLKHLCNLATSLRTRFDSRGARTDLETAAALCREASEVTSAAPSLRIRAARVAAELWAQAGSVDLAADAAESAILLLPYVAPRRLEHHDQQHMVGEFAGLAGEAAALALAVPNESAPCRAERALRLLESGRAVLHGLALESRSDVTDLRAHHPALALRFADLRERLDRSGYFLDSSDHIDTAAAHTDGLSTSASGSVRVHEFRRQLSEQFATLLAEIRALDGFAAFALPPDTSELLAAAADGPLVLLNVARKRGDALIVRSDGIETLPLSGITTQSVAEQAAAFHAALGRRTSKEEVLQAQRDIDRVLKWLWDTAAGPVIDALGITDKGRGDGSTPRIWWVPCGRLALLPVHAAGHHADPSDTSCRRTVLDRAVSSYTPTIRALRHARQRAAAAGTSSGSALVVAMPTTPGLPSERNLDGVWEEVAAVRSLWPDAEVLVEAAADATGAGTPPTRHTVLERLPHHTVAHFACHGDSDPTDPSQSGLLLLDHDTGRLTVAALRPVNLDKAQLAYLSACRTAAIEAFDLTDESIHLVSAMQLAGFPQVIGTLWQVNDTVAAAMASEFYGTLTPGRSAVALHRATQQMRVRYPRLPYLWAAYVHSGS
ncbi:CHAT domain-containing protein [Streptomyces sp. NPDC090106]|uniref:CHAT domain-containing protein n=1 Tax=Streptomyces sp. NPDC090106 TaxID=3365946 RepID=UPI0037F2B471